MQVYLSRQWDGCPLGLRLVVEEKSTKFFMHMYMYGYFSFFARVHVCVHVSPLGQCSGVHVHVCNDSQFQLLARLHHDLQPAPAQLLTQQWEGPGPLGAGPRQTAE